MKYLLLNYSFDFLVKRTFYRQNKRFEQRTRKVTSRLLAVQKSKSFQWLF